MRVRDLRGLLRDLERIFGVSGAKTQQDAVANVADALPHDRGQEQDLAVYLKKVEEELADDAAPPSAKYVRRLREAGLAEDAFLAALNSIEADKRIKKADLLAIAQAYTGSADRKASVRSLLKQMRAHFYTKLYERDANELAKRAKPV
ncbi:MAG TPA: hypothetical protein VN524_06885 [Hyphomicrobiaceae bacterium]|nr:hypothetical protein [Hyphomicrobiaceae bacterium]